MLSLVSTTRVVVVHLLGDATVIFASCDSVRVKLSAGGGKQLLLLTLRMSLKSSFSLPWGRYWACNRVETPPDIT